MTIPLPPSEEEHLRDVDAWAKQGALFRVVRVPTGALNLNVEGREALSPLQGFGQMWQKTFRVRLADSPVQPAGVIKTWKQNFATFWPKGYRFFAPLTGIAPGEVALINMPIPGGIPLSTGVMVLYADDESFTFMTPQGHTFSGWITFSAYEEEQCTIAQVQVLMRPNDIAYELGYRFLGADKAEDRFWQHTLTALAAHFGSVEPVETRKVCIDPRWQWSQFWNIWHNSAIRTTLYKLTAPVRWIGRSLKH